MPRAGPIAPPTSTSPASTVRTTTSTCRTSCGRSSSDRIPTASPTTAGRAWAGRASATAPTARSRSGRRRAAPCRSAADWDDPAYRAWIEWNYARRIEIWELNNRVTRDAGGPDCIWSGMNSGSVTAQARSFRDSRRSASRADIIMLDHQRRDDDTGFQQNGDTGKRVHGAARLGQARARVDGDVRVRAGLLPRGEQAGGGGADVDDRRDCRRHPAVVALRRRVPRGPPDVPHAGAGDALVARPTSGYLVDRTPVATVGVVWSQRNTDFFGRDDPGRRVDAPYTGFMHALVRARIPYLPVHVDDIERPRSAAPRSLILPNVGALSDAQAASIRRFVERGGSLLATGADGAVRRVGRAARRLRARRSVRLPCCAPASGTGRRRARAIAAAGAFAPSPRGHTYLRLTPELRGARRRPARRGRAAAVRRASPVLRGFDETDILAFGGSLAPLRVEPSAIVPLTFIPPFPTYPPETAWMRRAEDGHSRAWCCHEQRRGPRGVHAGRHRPPLRR